MKNVIWRLIIIGYVSAHALPMIVVALSPFFDFASFLAWGNVFGEYGSVLDVAYVRYRPVACLETVAIVIFIITQRPKKATRRISYIALIGLLCYFIPYLILGYALGPLGF